MTEKSKAIDQAILQIEKQFGKGAIMKLGASADQKVETIPSGSLTLDLALGIGGYPRGRVVEIFGPEASGKTTLALHAVGSVQRAGGTAAFIDAEHALDATWARTCGVNTDEMLISQPDNGEQALDIVETLVRSNAVDVIVVDSVAALVPKAEIEGEMGQQHMGLHARLMSQALRKLTGIISKSKTILIFINQTRMKIGIVFGNPETTTGGNALKFYASIRIEVRRAAQIKQAEKIIGNRVKAKIVKNKVAPPFRTTEFDIMYNEGISISGDALDAGVAEGVVQKSGNTYALGGEKLGIGREAAKNYLKMNPALIAQIRTAVFERAAEKERAELTPAGGPPAGGDEPPPDDLE